MFDDLKKRLGLYVDKVMNNTTPTFKTPNAKPQSINQLRVNIPRNISSVKNEVQPRIQQAITPQRAVSNINPTLGRSMPYVNDLRVNIGQKLQNIEFPRVGDGGPSNIYTPFAPIPKSIYRPITNTILGQNQEAINSVGKSLERLGQGKFGSSGNKLEDYGNALFFLPITGGGARTTQGGVRIGGKLWTTVKTISPEAYANTLKNGRVGKLLDVAKTQMPEYSKGNITPDEVRKYMMMIQNGDSVNPIVVDARGKIVDGAHKLLAAKQLGMKKFPTVIEGADDAATQFGRNLVANRWGKLNFNFKEGVDVAKNTLLPKAGTGDKGFINFGELFGKPKPKTTTQVAKDTLKVERQGVSLKNIIPQKDANGVPNLGAEIDMTLPTEKKLAVAANQVREVLDLQNALRTKSTASQAEAIKKLKETYAGMKMTPEVQAELDSKIAKIMSGEKEQVAFNNRLREVFSQQEIDTLINKVETAKYDDVFEYMNLRNDIRQLFGEGVNGEKLLQNSQVKRLKLLYDEELINALNEPKNRKAARLLAEVFGVQKALRATFDLSATLRQGLFLAARHPKKAAVGFKDELRYWFSESAYNGMMQELMQRPNKAIYDRSGLAIIDPQAADLTKREDVFISHLLEEVPGIGGVIKRSDRAFTGFLTKMRADVMDDYIRMSKEAGIPQTEALYKGFANWINVASGRGGLGILEGAPANALNSVFFSPRLISSRLQLINPYFYYKLGKEDRFILHQALRTWMNLGAMGGTTLTLAKLSGLGDVSLDPRSADFGKVKVNNTRYDIWGGVQQPFVAAWQFASGEKINTTTGKLTKLGEKFSSPTRWDVALNYFRNKLAPGPSMIYSKMEGKTPTGEDFDGIKALIESLHPLIWDDWYDMAQDGNFNRAAMVLPFVGVGTQTYGEQEITRGENILGQPVTELKAKPSLTEKFVSDPIRGFLGRENTLTPTSGQSIKAYVNQLEKMSNEEARGQVIEIARENPELAKKILEEVSNRARGITVDDESLKEKGVADGTRAKAVIDNINKLDTEAERRQYVIELYQKKVITRDVLEQIVEYYSRQ